MNTVRIDKTAILIAWGSSTILNIPHTLCENCDKPIIDHEWIDLDPDNVIVRCSFNDS